MSRIYHHVPRNSRRNKYYPRHQVPKLTARKKTELPFREEDLEPDILQYLKTTRILDPTPSDTKMKWRAARAIIRDPEKMRRLKEIYATWGQLTPNKLDEPIFTKADEKEIPLAASPTHVSVLDISTESLDAIAEIRKTLTERRKELLARREFLVELQQTIREMQDKLKHAMASNPSHLKDMADQLAELFNLMRGYLLSSSLLCALNMQKIQQVNREAIRKEVERDESEVRVKTRDINAAIDEFDDKLGKLSIEGQARHMVMADYFKTFHEWFVSAKIYFSQRRWIKKDFNVRITNLVREYQARIEALTSERIARAVTYLDSRERLDAYDRNSTVFHELNDGISRLNRELEVLKTTVERKKKELAASQKPRNGLGSIEIEGDLRDPSVKVRVIDYTGRVKQHYATEFEQLNSLINRVIGDIDEITNQCERVVASCIETESKVRRIHSEEKSEHAKPTKDDVLEVYDRAIRLIEIIEDPKRRLIELATPQWEAPKNFEYLRSLVARLGNSDAQRFIGVASETLQSRGLLADRARLEQLPERTIIEAIRTLDKDATTAGLKENERRLLERLTIASGNPAFKTALILYAVGASCRGVEIALFERAMNEIIYGTRQEIFVEDQRMDQLVFAANAITKLRGKMHLVESSIFESEYRIDDHALRHTGWIADIQHTSEVVIRRDEARLWDMLREGGSSYSLRALHLDHSKDVERKHYIAVVQAVLRTATPFVATYGYEDRSTAVHPTLFFVSDLAEHGIPNHNIYVGFRFALRSSAIDWKTAFITETKDTLTRAKLSFVSPIGRQILMND